jgi:hypothetical protein
MNLPDTNITFRYFRFYELKDMFIKNELVFEDFGYVDDIDLYLTGCLVMCPNSFNFILKKPYTLLGELGCKRFKTIIDFTENKIKCQGLYFNEIEGYLRHRILDMNISANLIIFYSIDSQEYRDFQIEYFKNNF